MSKLDNIITDMYPAYGEDCLLDPKEAKQALKDLFKELIGEVEAGQFGEEADFALSELRQKVEEL